MANVTLEQVLLAAQNDLQYVELCDIIQTGFPKNRHAVEPTHLREYWEVRDKLSVVNKLAFLADRIIIPRSLRKMIVKNLHSAHQGVTGMLSRARDSIYWPGITKNIQHQAAIRSSKSARRTINALRLTKIFV